MDNRPPVIYPGWAQNYDIYHQVAHLMKHKTVLPDEGWAQLELQLHSDGRKFWTTCLPKYDTVGPRRHRVLVHCTCNRLIPFGRMGQHFHTHNKEPQS